MKVKIVKSVNSDYSDAQVASGCFSTNFCSWDRLKDLIIHATGRSNSEEIVGFRATEQGVEILFEN